MTRDICVVGEAEDVEKHPCAPSLNARALTRCSDMVSRVLSRRLESVDLADVSVRESGAVFEVDDSKNRRNVSSVGADDHKQP